MSLPDFLTALVLWGLWTTYWIASAGRSKPVDRRESPASRTAQTIAISAGGLLVLVPGLGLPAFDATAFTPWPKAGTALVAAGLGFMVWARRSLGDNWSAEVSIRQGHELVRAGPYGWVRHPIYTGGLVAVAGTFLMGGLWRGAIGVVLIVATLVYKLRLEETWLSGVFGDAYARYRAEVRALVPGVW